jgi:hypothetical protein
VGFFANGKDGESCTGGKSFINGGEGGQRQSDYVYGADGGFGGGGAAFHEGGGGGGYIGGNCVPQNQYNSVFNDYGAYSFNSGDNQCNQANFNPNDGQVTIEYLG